MKFCPECGAEVVPGRIYCSRCGYDLSSHPAVPAPEPAAPRSSRGLYIAIACVAALCVLTAGLWIFWPHLKPARVSSGGGGTAASTPLAPEKTPASVPASENSLLQPKSWWRGYLTIRNYKGDKDLDGESMEVWGYIGKENDGRTYFEVYDQDTVTDDTTVLVSFYADLCYDYLSPVIGNDDAWVMDLDLTPQDAGSLIVYLKDQRLFFYYPYKSATDSFDLEIVLSPK